MSYLSSGIDLSFASSDNITTLCNAVSFCGKFIIWEIYANLQVIVIQIFYLQCFDAVGWAAGTASSL